MPETVLCEGNPRVSVDGLAERSLIVVTNGLSVRFWTATEHLDAALTGTPIQLSADEGFLRIEAVNGVVHFAYELGNEGLKECEIPSSALEAAIAIVRAQMITDINNPSVIVEEVP